MCSVVRHEETRQGSVKDGKQGIFSEGELRSCGVRCGDDDAREFVVSKEHGSPESGDGGTAGTGPRKREDERGAHPRAQEPSLSCLSGLVLVLVVPAIPC